MFQYRFYDNINVLQCTIFFLSTESNIRLDRTVFYCYFSIKLAINACLMKHQ